MTKAWLDPMTAWITFGRLHPDSEVRSHFSNKAREHAPLQYVAILREIFIVMDPAALDVIREAVAEAAVGWGLESGLEQLSWFSQEPSRAKLARFLKNAIGIVGKHNRGRVDEESDGQDAFVVRAKRWQKDWLTGWLMAQMMHHDVQINGVNVFKHIYAQNPLLALIVRYFVTGDKRFFKQAQLESSLGAIVYLFRFGTDDVDATASYETSRRCFYTMLL